MFKDKECQLQNGFTLIELMLVIAIMLILAGALIPIINVSRRDARIAKAYTEIEAIKKAARLMRSDTGKWPTADCFNLAGGRACWGGEDLISNPNNISGWEGPYLSNWPSADPWGQYRYIIWDPDSGNPSIRWVLSLGPDKGWGSCIDTNCTDGSCDICLSFTPNDGSDL